MIQLREAVAADAAVVILVPASLNIKGQINGGGIQTSGSGTARWIIDDASIRGEDGSTVDHGAGPGVTAAIKADGSFFGSNILLQSAASGARLTLDASVPIEQIIDPSGYARAELGDLATKGISLGGYKFRASNASNVPIFDSDGLISVMQQPSPAAHVVAPGPGPWTVPGGVGVWTPIPSVSVTFALARPTTMKADGVICAQATAATASSVITSISFNSGIPDPDGNSALFDTAGGANSNASFFLSETLAAGTWTAYLLAALPVGSPVTTLDVWSASLYVFQLGA